MIGVALIILGMQVLRVNGPENVPTGRYVYRCEISDVVSFNDVMENFNVVGCENGVYILEDK